MLRLSRGAAGQCPAPTAGVPPAVARSRMPKRAVRGRACRDGVSGDLRLLWTGIGKVAPRPNGSQRPQDSAFPKQSGEAGQDDTTLLVYWEGEQETEALNPYKGSFEQERGAGSKQESQAVGTAHVGGTGGLLGGTSCLWALCWGGGSSWSLGENPSTWLSVGHNFSFSSTRTIQVFLFRFINVNGVSPVLMSTHKARAHC